MTDNLYRRALTALLDAAEARDFDPPVPTELVAALEHAAQEEDFCGGCAEKENRLAAFRAHAKADIADLKAQRAELAGLLRDCHGLLKALDLHEEFADGLNAEISAALAKLD